MTTPHPEPAFESEIQRAANSPPPLDYRADLGPLGHDVPPRLCAAPALLPIPLDMISDADWHPPQLVVVGALQQGWMGMALRLLGSHPTPLRGGEQHGSRGSEWMGGGCQCGR